MKIGDVLTLGVSAECAEEGDESKFTFSRSSDLEVKSAPFFFPECIRNLIEAFNNRLLGL